VRFIVAQYANQRLWYAYPYHSYQYSYRYVARLARRGGEGAGTLPTGPPTNPISIVFITMFVLVYV